VPRLPETTDGNFIRRKIFRKWKKEMIQYNRKKLSNP
jgi:hypothetical protein